MVLSLFFQALVCGGQDERLDWSFMSLSLSCRQCMLAICFNPQLKRSPRKTLMLSTRSDAARHQKRSRLCSRVAKDSPFGPSPDSQIWKLVRASPQPEEPLRLYGVDYQAGDETGSMQSLGGFSC